MSTVLEIATRKARRVRRKGIAPAVVPTEHQEQAAFFAWCERHKDRHPLLGRFFAIPNFFGNVGSFSARINAGRRAKAEGRKKGYPDIGHDSPRQGFTGLRMETKRVKGGSVDPEQKEWHEWLRSQGLRVEVCKGHEALIAVAKDYLGITEDLP